MSYVLDVLAAGLFGGAVGAGEIVSRYKDEPGKVMRTFPAIIYALFDDGERSAVGDALAADLACGAASGRPIAPTRPVASVSPDVEGQSMTIQRRRGRDRLPRVPTRRAGPIASR